MTRPTPAIATGDSTGAQVVATWSFWSAVAEFALVATVLFLVGSDLVGSPGSSASDLPLVAVVIAAVLSVGLGVTALVLGFIALSRGARGARPILGLLVGLGTWPVGILVTAAAESIIYS